MHDDMVERVARAMAEFHERGEEYWQAFVDDVNAALAAIEAAGYVVVPHETKQQPLTTIGVALRTGSGGEERVVKYTR